MSEESHLFLGFMGYESLSTVIVLVIVVIALAVWLPQRTANGMDRVNEHRQDRYSPSMHLVDADSGTRFSDERTPQAKGAIMQSSRSRGTALTPERIAEVRRLRRAAIRRRRIIAASLLAITVVVLAISFPLGFSPLFALIPAALLAMVLALGARASKHAREWEAKVAAARKHSASGARSGSSHDSSHTVTAKRSDAATRQLADAAATPGADAPHPANEQASRQGDAVKQTLQADQQQGSESAVHDKTRDNDGSFVPTDVLEQREIRRALHDAEQERAEAVARRRERRREREEQLRAEAEQAAARQSAVEERADATASNAPDAASESTSPAGSVQHGGLSVEVSDNVTKPSAELVHVGDATTELDRIHSAGALDAFDMATSQDLISFSLGAPREGFDAQPQAPESLEIRSTRQVAKAVPVEQTETQGADAQTAHDGEAPSDASRDSGQAEAQPESPAVEESAIDVQELRDGERFDEADASLNDAAAFHEHEVEAQVDAPEASSDSLGTGLDAILARRGV